MRDSYRDGAYYNDLVEVRQELAEKDLDPKHIEYMSGFEEICKCVLPSNSAQMLLGAVLASYSRGDSRVKIREKFAAYCKVLLMSEACFVDFGERDSANDINLIDASVAFPTIAFASAFLDSKEQIGKLAQCIPPGYDTLVDRVMAQYQPGRPVHDKLRKKSVHGPLLKLLDAPPDKQPALIHKYLDNWETYLQRDNRWPSHHRPTFDGYWCYEAAAIVCAFDIDDSEFIDHQYYPTDLMNWRNA